MHIYTPKILYIKGVSEGTAPSTKKNANFVFLGRSINKRSHSKKCDNAVIYVSLQDKA